MRQIDSVAIQIFPDTEVFKLTTNSLFLSYGTKVIDSSVLVIISWW